MIQDWKKVALRLVITGSLSTNESTVVIEVLGEDEAMLPTTIKEMEEGIKSWTCISCGALLEEDVVEQISDKKPIKCSKCGVSLEFKLFRK